MTLPKAGAHGPGRASIFRDKKDGARLQGIITKAGSQRFEAARKRLARLAARDAEEVSDADTIEYLARGEAETVKYLRA
jgi:hypothetical protein